MLKETTLCMGDKEFEEILLTLTLDGGKPRKMQHKLKVYQVSDGLHFLGDRICTKDQNLRQRILKEYHNSPMSSHPGVDQTYLQIQRLIHWENMDKSVRIYVQSCDTCQRMKYDGENIGLIQPLTVPDQIWESVSFDFVTHLLLTDTGVRL